MPDRRAHHCPFLNRADHRCSSHFSVERLSEAYEHCFDEYKSCGVYHELLVERQARRGAVFSAAVPASWTRPPSAHGNSKFVQITVHHHDQTSGVSANAYAKPAA